MGKKHITVEVITEGDERFLLMTYADGTKERVAIVRATKRRDGSQARLRGIGI